MYLLAEVAIIATDMAEVVGSAIALNLLTGLPLAAGVAITAADVFVVLLLFGDGKHQKTASTMLEVLVICLVTTVFICFMYLLDASDIDAGQLFRGYVPSAVLFTDPAAVLISVGIVGATVMPHNLYLHSALIRDHSRGIELPKALRIATIDILLTLCIAFIVNSAILIVAAANFNASGHFEVEELQDAYYLLQSLVGPAFATVFAVSLLCSGQSSTITGTLAGQVVAEGFMEWRFKPWIRRLITRLLAIIPSLIVVLSAGEGGLGELLIVSQVILSMQLPFAFFPLVYFTSKPEIMGAQYANHRVVKWLGYAIGVVLVGLNIFLLVELGLSA